jgi:hypothetical protein
VEPFACALFRELAPMVIEDRSNGLSTPANKRRVLLACEQAIERIEAEPGLVARPDISLFTAVRDYISPGDWEGAEQIIRRNLRRAGIHFARASRREHVTLARG